MQQKKITQVHCGEMFIHFQPPAELRPTSPFIFHTQIQLTAIANAIFFFQEQNHWTTKQVRLRPPEDIKLTLTRINALRTIYGHDLLTGWNLREIYAIVAEDHHLEEFDPKNDLLVIIRSAELTCNKPGGGTREHTDIILAATAEADHLGLSEIKTAELEIRVEDAIGLAK